MKDFFQNQIALALIVFVVIVIGAYATMGASAKDVIVQAITATGSLVTGVAIGNKRATDIPPTTEVKKEG